MTGAIRTGLGVHLAGANNATASTDANGSNAFAGLADGSYEVSLPITGFAVTPPTVSVELSGADAGHVDFAVAVPDVADSPASGPQGAIAVGPDGNLWFADGAWMGRGCVGRW